MNAEISPVKENVEAKPSQLELARWEGEGTRRAAEEMITQVAKDGAEIETGDYCVAYAIQEAEGYYARRDGDLEWQEPGDETIHVQIIVRDRADGRFIPGLSVEVTILDAADQLVATREHPFVWHPWVHHYGRNWKISGNGIYTLEVRIEAPRFPRSDKANGKRYLEGVEVEFPDVVLEIEDM